jgi:membrane-associated protease RseP (regulator of RpoE activity)
LRWLRDLAKITFVGPQVTDQWIESIQEMDELRFIAIKNARVTDQSLRTISRLKSLVFVDLMYSPVTDQGFEQLRELKSVRQIRCFGTKISRAAADRFQLEVADVNVQHKQGAFLGVSCQQPPWPCQVVRVTPDSAAATAGVKEDDIIVQFDGQPVGSFEDLQKLIAVKEVGDSVDIRVARGAERSLSRIIRQQPFGDLGIEFESTTLGLRVAKIDPEKGAAKAGIRAGDVIVSLDDVRTVTQQQWRKLYEQMVPQADRRAGVAEEAEKVKRVDREGENAPVSRRVELVRDVKFLSMKVTFGEWDERLLP